MGKENLAPPVVEPRLALGIAREDPYLCLTCASSAKKLPRLARPVLKRVAKAL